ncbi:hypothetical protein ARMSODRAFT_47858 [Armillaria solidipes]|uniref:Uncharacterized protein n=1 Tax=Armillaria solidipes TaxID=1076256 RepID=A0A2H3CHE2_9AGAR|nr:hypothetical protein ARMSODRAFT_47858 [Armillaria solidipes]
MASFLVSFLSMCLEAPNPRSLKVSVVLTYLFITAVGSWCIFWVWEGSDQWMERFLASQRNLLSDTKNSLRLIFSRENLCRLRDKAWRMDSRTGGSILPTTANGE